jgi:hypothetical protein
VERGGCQLPIYFASRALKDAEVRYPLLEKSALAMVHTSRRLRRYFQAFKVTVLTNLPIKNVLAKPENAGRLEKWAIELGEHDISFSPRVAIKGQVLADFLIENEIDDTEEVDAMIVEEDAPKSGEWQLYIDGASSAEGSGAGLILFSPEGKEITYALRLNFASTNNEAEYEAMLAG